MGQTATFMLKNHDIPDASTPDMVCVDGIDGASCDYGISKNWDLMSFCPSNFPHIGKRRYRGWSTNLPWWQ